VTLRAAWARARTAPPRAGCSAAGGAAPARWRRQGAVAAAGRGGEGVAAAGEACLGFALEARFRGPCAPH